MDASKIFQSYRALGYVSNHVPLTVRFVKIRKEHLLSTVVDRCFHTYGSDHLKLLSISNPHESDITCVAGDTRFVFTACDKTVYAWRRGTELEHKYPGHQKPVHLLLPFAAHLLSVDESNEIRIWDIDSEECVTELNLPKKVFKITAILHPSTYLNKILLGSFQGSLQLWNIRTLTLLYTFKGWKSQVLVLEQAPAIDVVAIGLASGDIYLHNLKFDETVVKFTQEYGPVIGISFRTDNTPQMATASPVGHVAIWDLENKKLHSQIRHAHKGAVTGLKFLANEPCLSTSSPDNSLKIWIFDQSDGSGRLLKQREGHSATPTKIRFYGANGNHILSAGLDSTLRAFSTKGDNLNKNLGQASYNRKLAKKKGIAHDPLKLTPITDFTCETTREKEWDSVAACHRSKNVVTTWSFEKCRMGEHKLNSQTDRSNKNVAGIANLDYYLGGGLPIGSILLIEEGSDCAYSSLIAKYFVAEGIVHKHTCFISSSETTCQSFLKSLPAVSTVETKKVAPIESEPMKIAWRYQDLPVNKGSTLRLGSDRPHSFNLSQTMDPKIIEECHIMTHSIDPTNLSHNTSQYETLLSLLVPEIKKFSSSCSPKGLLRVVINGLGDPLWCRNPLENSKKNLLNFLNQIRSLARFSYAIFLITIPTVYYQELGNINKLRLFTDYIIELEPLIKVDDKINPAFKDYHGLFHFRKRSAINSVTPFVTDTSDLVFKSTRKGFVIEKLHLPPDLSETVSRSSEDPKITKERIKSLACGAPSGHNKLDF